MKSFLLNACAAVAFMAFSTNAMAETHGSFAFQKNSQIILAATSSPPASTYRSSPPASTYRAPPSSNGGGLGLPPKPGASPNTSDGLPPKPGASPNTSAGLPPKPGASPNTAAGLPPKPGAGTVAAPAATSNAMTTAANRRGSQAALDRYRTANAGTKLPPAAPVAPSVARSTPVYSATVRAYPTRAAYYRAYESGWSGYGRTLVIYRPSYGIWDSHVFAAALAVESANNIAWLYAMQHSQDAANRAAYEQWRIDQLADERTRQLMLDREARMASMPAPAKAPDLPDGVNVAMAVAPTTVLADSSIPDDDDDGGIPGWIWFGLGAMVALGGVGYWLMQRGRAYRAA